MIENKTATGFSSPQIRGIWRYRWGWKGQAVPIREWEGSESYSALGGAWRLMAGGLVIGDWYRNLRRPGYGVLIPLPSTAVRMRSIAGIAISSTAPLGQRISSFSILVAAPSPKWTRGSEVEA